MTAPLPVRVKTVSFALLQIRLTIFFIVFSRTLYGFIIMEMLENENDRKWRTKRLLPVRSFRAALFLIKIIPCFHIYA